jgi:hypothetical protein
VPRLHLSQPSPRLGAVESHGLPIFHEEFLYCKYGVVRGKGERKERERRGREKRERRVIKEKEREIGENFIYLFIPTNAESQL